MTGAVRKATGWVFRDRRTGRIVIAQRPNAPLIVALACFVAHRLVAGPDPWPAVLTAAGTAALVVWAGDEVVRGVNPWRRALGAAVLAVLGLEWALG
jgi:hypothetical protein